VTTVPSTATAATGTATGSAGTFTQLMSDNVFGTKTFTLSIGQPVTFNLVNNGKVVHNMRIADAKGSYDSSQSAVSVPELVPAGKTGTLTWTPTAAGTYDFRCDVHPDQMTGTITVK
ncbi:MAG: cupredoxin domain-containing protein, partial [Anaerolineaceae bacterium]